MDEQGHGTENWKHLEDWALTEILKIVELRDDRYMPGSPELRLQDLIGKQLRVRYKEIERIAHERRKREHGTFVFTITSIQASDDPRGEIQFGIAPHEVPLVNGLSARFYAVRIIPRGSDATTFSVTLSALTLQMHGHSHHELSDIMVTNIHVLWD